MRKKLSILLYIPAVVLIVSAACGSMKTMSLNSVELTGQLRPGMSYAEVESILGKPKSSRVEDDKWIARWNLQEMWKGYVPYDMVFNAKDQTLISWAENTKAYEAQQAQMKVVADEIGKQSAPAGNPGTTGSVNPAPSFESNQELMNYFKGKWYSFTSAGYGYTASSERRISLCGNGTYRASFESGYSGQDWGQANQGGGGGTWKITGSKTDGTIVTTDPGGKSTTYNYKTCGDGCLYIGSYKYAYEGSPDCR
jgi:hypothetical protein